MENDQAVLPEDGATQKSAGKLPLIGVLIGFAVIAVSIICTCLGGLVATKETFGEDMETAFGDMGIFEFFNFGKGSTWDTLITLMKFPLELQLGTLLQYMLGAFTVAFTLICLFAMLIRSIVMLSRGMKTGDFGKAYGSAYGAYAAFLGGQLAILALFAGDPQNYKLNTAAIAGAVIGGVLICVTVALRFLPSAKKVFLDEKALLRFILAACGTACVVVVLIFVWKPLIKAGEFELNFLQCLNFKDPEGSIGSLVLIFGTIGVLSTLLLVLSSVMQLVRYLQQLSVPSVKAESSRKVTWFASVMLFCGILAALLAPEEFKTKIGPAHIVILVFVVVNFVLATVDYMKQKETKKKN